jgi:hypothetical protein
VEGRLTGVVDWAYASWGPAAVDAGHLRWNLALAHGLDAADALLALPGVEHHPYWDLVALLDVVGDPDALTPVQGAALEPYAESLLERSRR